MGANSFTMQYIPDGAVNDGEKELFVMFEDILHQH